MQVVAKVSVQLSSGRLVEWSGERVVKRSCFQGVKGNQRKSKGIKEIGGNGQARQREYGCTGSRQASSPKASQAWPEQPWARLISQPAASSHEAAASQQSTSALRAGCWLAAVCWLLACSTSALALSAQPQLSTLGAQPQRSALHPSA